MRIRITIEDVSSRVDMLKMYYETENSVEDLAYEIGMLFMHLQEVDENGHPLGEMEVST